MKKIYIIVPIVLAALLGTYYILGFYNRPPQTQGNGSNNGQSNSGDGQVTSQTREFTVNGHAYGFSPSTIEVNKGDNVKITFISDDILHDLVIDGYNVGTDVVSSGDSYTIQFIADRSGTFTFYCSVDGHSDAGMVGKLIVVG